MIRHFRRFVVLVADNFVCSLLSPFGSLHFPLHFRPPSCPTTFASSSFGTRSDRLSLGLLWFLFASAAPNMLRSFVSRALQVSRQALVPSRSISVTSSRLSKHSEETDEEFDARYEAFFNRKDIDGWEIRKAMNDLCGMDLVPEPKIITSALRACRRVNDYALGVRFLEAVQDKCGNRVKEIYPYILQEIRPTLTELGMDTPEELGYDQPELALQSVYDMH